MAKARRTALEIALGDYDGKHADVLKELREEFSPTAAVLRQCVKLAAHDDALIAQGATWLLWSWLTSGSRLTPRVIAELAQLLPGFEDKWVLLHLVRCVPLMDVPGQHAVAYAEFLQRCCGGQLPFLRAWAMDSLHRLALQHEQLEAQARAAMEAAADDPAPSVRKRLQKILQGK
tara:strand:+ start:4143 stop:4667 length:525 start_codon:yes stop_codon:yes gene_type:complete